VTADQKKRLLKAKWRSLCGGSSAAYPKRRRIEQVTLLTRVMYRAVLGLHYKRREQKQTGQLAIF
jgi:hypothetical protein